MNNSCSYGFNNNKNNSNNHETLFWKVFRNAYIRNYIFSIIANNNLYNGRTSLELMLDSNKLHIILDKLKSNHHIHIDCIPDWNQQRELFKIKDPFYKSIINQIDQLLWLNYSSIRNAIFMNIKDIEYSISEKYKLCYPDNKNNYNNYMAHTLLYKLLNSDYHYNNIQHIQYFYQLINNNKEYNHTIKKQKINNNTNNKREYFIQQLISTSSSSSSTSSSSSSVLPTLESEITEAIYNDQPIPIHINQYYSNQKEIKIYNNYNQDLFENQLKVDICSILLGLNKNTVIYNCNDKEVLELISLKLLYHHHFTISLESANQRITDYPVNSIIHAKIYCLNKLNGWKDKYKETASSILKFKQHLINNQVNTLDELISVARDTFKGLDYKKCFGHYYYYHLITSNQLDKFSFNSQDFTILLLNYSIITQQTELFDRYLKLSKGVVTNSYENLISDRISIGLNNNNDQLIKDKSITYFNHVIKEIKNLYKIKFGIHKYWNHIFNMIIRSYNSKLFEWLLESNKELKDIYHKLVGNSKCFKGLFLAHTRIDIHSDQVDYEMLDVLIKHIKIIEFPEDHKLKSEIGLDSFIIRSNQRNVKILNHLIKSPSNSNNKYVHSIVCNLFNSFKKLESVDDIIKIYNQIDQQLLFNYYSSINDNQHQYTKLDISTYQNKSSILVPLLIRSIIELDFNSINKIISATLNKYIYIATTFNNSLDIVKYLISKQYLKEFSLYCILDQIISNIQVDKEFIMELIRLSNNNQISHTTTNNEINGITTVNELILEFEQRYIDIYQKRKDQHKNELEINQHNNQLFSLSTLERIKCEDRNTNNYQFLSGTELENIKGGDMLSNAISIYYLKGYYNAIYQFLNQNRNIYIEFNLKPVSISIKWFSKLYLVLFKDLLYTNRIINQHCCQNPPELFEFIWNNHFKTNKRRIEYILGLFQDLDNENDQLIEYVFKTKREFIITSVYLDQSKLLYLHQLFLFFKKIYLFHQVRLTFPSFNFEINQEIIESLFQGDRYEVIEYLFENNLIPNLEQIIGTANLNRLTIKEYNYDDSCRRSSGFYGYVSKSMFILIHTIIKLQKQQQLNK